MPFINNGDIMFSVFTSVVSGGWWDTGSPSDLGRTFLNQAYTS